MRLRIAASSVVGVIVLAIFGAVMGPAWNPHPVVAPLVPGSSETRITGASGPPIGTYRVTRTVVPVHLDGADVQATIYRPVGVTGLVPGMVFVHGAGTGRHESAFSEQASLLASAGIATMVPDKRRDTYTVRHRDYPTMAVDYAASVRILRATAGVDPAGVGVYGESEGCWIVPVMSARDPAIAFTVLTSGPVVPPREQAAFAIDAYLRNTGVPDGVFRAIPRAVGMAFPGGGFEYADFDVLPYLRRTTQPVLVDYGTLDPSMPVVQGAQLVIDSIAKAGNHDYTVRYYAGANHGIRIGTALHPAFLPDMAGWIHGLPATAHAEPRVAGATPHQTFLAAPVPGTRWFGDGDVVVGTVVGGVGLVLVFPLVLVLGAALRRSVRLSPGLAWPAVGVCVGAVATVIALVVYLVTVARIAMDYEHNAMAVKGGWLAVRLLGILTVTLAAVLVERLRDLSRDPAARIAGGRFGYVALGAGLSGGVLLLLSLAYWGVFQLGI